MSFTLKRSKFHGDFTNSMKIPEKVLCFRDNGASSCCEKFCMFKEVVLFRSQ